jgi:hypothetical protein
VGEKPSTIDFICLASLRGSTYSPLVVISESKHKDEALLYLEAKDGRTYLAG